MSCPAVAEGAHGFTVSSLFLDQPAEAKKQLAAKNGGTRATHFDSNSITPGTEFLRRVQGWVESYISERLQASPWRGLFWHLRGAGSQRKGGSTGWGGSWECSG